MEASMEVTSTEVFRGRLQGIYFHGSSMKASTKVTSTEASMKASTKVTSTENSTEAFVEVHCFHGSFHGSFYGRFHGSFHESFRGSKFAFMELPWK